MVADWDFGSKPMNAALRACFYECKPRSNQTLKQAMSKCGKVSYPVIERTIRNSRIRESRIGSGLFLQIFPHSNSICKNRYNFDIGRITHISTEFRGNESFDASGDSSVDELLAAVNGGLGNEVNDNILAFERREKRFRGEVTGEFGDAGWESRFRGWAGEDGDLEGAGFEEGGDD